MELLPDYILENIIKKLDKKTIETAATVCLRWRKIIASSSDITKLLLLRFDIKSSKKLDVSIADLDKIPYQRISFLLDGEQDQKLLSRSIKVIRKHSHHITDASLVCGTTLSISRVMDALVCDNITNMTILPTSKDPMDENWTIHLPNLKVLKTFKANHILGMIKSHKIEELRFGSDTPGHDLALNRFFLTCRDLKKLTIEEEFPIIYEENMPFKLKHLAYIDTHLDPKFLTNQQLECIKNMIEVSCDSLEEFDFHNCMDIIELVEFLLSKVKNLKCLTFWCSNSFPHPVKFQTNHTITKIFGSFDYEPEAELPMMTKLFESCPAVEVLDFTFTRDMDITPLIQAAALNMPNLKELSIYSLIGTYSNDFPALQNLETLRIRNINCQCDVLSFLSLMQAAPKLRKLKIDKWGGNRLPYLTKGNLKEILTSCKELEEIFIGGQFNLPESFVDGLLESESNIQNLVIETSQVDLARENARKLFNSKIRCTVMQFQPKQSDDGNTSDDEESSSNEETSEDEEASSDDDTSDDEEASDDDDTSDDEEASDEEVYYYERISDRGYPY